MKVETDRVICVITKGLAHVRFKGPQVSEFVEASQVGQDIRRIIGSHDFRVLVIDCEAFDFITSTLLEAFVTVYVRCRKEGREVRIVNAGPLIRDLLRVTKLDQIMPVYDRLDEALAP